MIIAIWLILCLLSFGIPSLIFTLMNRASSKPWQLEIDEHYRAKVSIIVPTYNEADAIRLKLENLVRQKYPEELMEIIIVDSNSNDNTVGIAREFIREHLSFDMKILAESERKGKSAALNLALRYCTGDIVIVSDADCFWPRDALRRALPFLADPGVGAISGPKTLLNSEHSWVTSSEQAYMDSLNSMKLGESKTSSTLIFEGGFAAFKKDAIEKFDPYSTGSDDSGTVICLAEKNLRALLVPEAEFWSVFPRTWKEKIAIKIRRANQFVRIFATYAVLLSRKRIGNSKRIVMQNMFLYLVSPIMFLLLVIATIFALSSFPYVALIFTVFLVPRMRFYLYEAILGYFVLLLAMLSVALGVNFLVWDKPKDRPMLNIQMIREHGLI